MIDAHAHLLPSFIKNIDPLIVNAKKAKLEGIVNSAIKPNQFSFGTFMAFF